MEKNIKYYMDLPYTRELIPEPEGGWFVRVKELPGCMSQGDTPEEAMAMIADAMALWLETALDHGMAIPEPRTDEDYSGKFVVRLPKSLHRKLVEQAEEDGVSLNQWIVAALAEMVGIVKFKDSVPQFDNKNLSTKFSDKDIQKFYNFLNQTYLKFHDYQIKNFREWAFENKYTADLNDNKSIIDSDQANH